MRLMIFRVVFGAYLCSLSLPLFAADSLKEITEREILRARLSQEEKQQRASEHLRAGEEALRSRQYQVAVEQFGLALALQPEMTAARRGREEALRYLEARTGVEGNTAARAMAQAQVRAEYNRTEVAQFYAQAEQAYQTASAALPEAITLEQRGQILNERLQKLETAENLAERANLRLEGMPIGEATTELKLALADLKVAIRRQRALYRDDLMQTQRDSALQRTEAEKQTLIDLENNRRQSMLKQAQSYFYKLEYSAAEAIINELLKLNPADNEARAMLLKIRDAKLVEREELVKDLQRENRKIMLQNLEKATISEVSFSTPMRYPRDWDILSKRKNVAEVPEMINEKTQDTRRKLEKAYSFDWTESPLVEVVLDNIRQGTGININTAQIPEDKREIEISFSPRNMRLDNIFKHIFRQINDPENAMAPENITYTINDAGIVNFTTLEAVEASKATEEKIFDLRDIFAAMESAGRMPGDFEGDYYGDEEGADEQINIKEVICRALPVDFPEDSDKLEYDETYRKLTLRRCTPEQIKKVANLLHRLRSELMIQVSVVARFLQLSDSFWEQFRSEFYDMNNYANSASNSQSAVVGGMSIVPDGTGAYQPALNLKDQLSQMGNNGNYNNPYSVTGNYNNNLAFAPGNYWSELMGSSFNGTFSGLSSVFGNSRSGNIDSNGLMMGLQQKGYLGDLQTQWFLQMVRENTRQDSLFAPHIVVYNNCYGWIRFGDILPLISGYEMPRNINQNDAFGLKPVIKMRNSGNSLQIEPVVSSDKKYITVCAEPKISRIVSFNRASNTFGPLPYKRVDEIVQIGNPPREVIQQRLVVDEEELGRGLAYTLDLPRFLMFEAKTYATVPDGGAVLMGGLSTNVNSRGRSGTPLLQDLPIIGTAFSSRYYQKDKLSYTCLISAKMILLDEEEARQTGSQ